jgi:hypothetical protein
MRSTATSAIITLLVQSSGQALGPYKPILPSGSLRNAQKAKLLLATVQISPDKFTYHDEPFSFKQAWVQRTKYDNRILLCFTLSGFKKQHRFSGFELDDFQFGALNKYFGRCSNWLDGHLVHDLDITSDGQNLPAIVQVDFYGSSKDSGYALHRAKVLEGFVFKITSVAASK